MNRSESFLSYWIAGSAVLHVVLLGLRFSPARPLSVAMIPVDFLYTTPAPPAQAPAKEPAPVPPAPAQKAAAKEKAPPKKKDVFAKPVPKKKEAAEPAAKKEPAESEADAKKQAASQPTSRILSTRQPFPFSYYARIVQQKVWREWDWSSATGRLKAVVFFQILRDGRVAKVRMEESSGESLFDQACLRAVQVAAPFSPLPDGYAEESLDIFFEFNFKD